MNRSHVWEREQNAVLTGTPILKDLHWLPIKYRIQYKVLLITFKALNGTAPQYISELICSTLHSITMSPLLFPELTQCTSCPYKNFGVRDFAHAAPKLWNFRPDSLRCQMTTDQLKKNLKTQLCNIASQRSRVYLLYFQSFQ